MKWMLALTAVFFISSQAFAFGDKPDLEKQKQGIDTLVKAFDIDPKYDPNIKEDWHPGDSYDARIQEWKGSSDKNSNKADCSMLVYVVKGKEKTSTIENPKPHLIEAMMKIDGQPPAKASISYRSHVKSSFSDNKKNELSSMNYEEKYKESKGGGGGSPEGNMAIAILTAPGAILVDAMTPGALKSKSNYNLTSEKNSSTGDFNSITIKSDGVNDKPSKRETTCYNMKRNAYRAVGWDEARATQGDFERKLPMAQTQLNDNFQVVDKAVKDGSRVNKENADSARTPATAPSNSSGIAK